MFFDNLFDDFEPFGNYSYRQQRPQTASLFRNDNQSIILRKILNDEYNYMCFDCHRETSDLDYFDLKNGIFLCYNCAQQHAKLSKEITQPMTGNIKSLEENELLLLYYGGNRNLFDFIRRHFPLLENMKPKDMFATKAMEYYRKLLRSKAYDEPEPEMPGKKKAYNSIFQNKITPVTERKNKNKNIRERRMRDQFDRDEDRDNIFSSTFFGDDLFNRNKRKNDYNDDEDYFNNEPADINKKIDEEEENDSAGMKMEKRKNSIEDKDVEKEAKTQRNVIHEPKYKKIETKAKKERNEKKDEIKVNTSNTLTINQIGEISRYPEALEIDGMDCE